VPDVDESARRRRARWALDAVVLAALYQAYSLIQGLVPAHRSVAEANGRRLFDVEQWLHLDPELALNHFVVVHGWLAQVCDYWYATLHFSVSIAVAVWLLSRHHGQARHLLNSLYAATALALVAFWLVPMAPPRLLTGGPFEDTLVQFHTWGGWGSGPVDAVANQYAALPSLHMAWSLWCAVVMVRCARSVLARRIVWLYPAGTLFVILATGNHWLLDAVAGSLVLGVGFALSSAALPDRRTAAMTVPATAASPGAMASVGGADSPARPPVG
jgi:PAP2 superfamily